MAVNVLAMAIDLHLPGSRSLKSKRSVVKSVTETCRRRFGVSVSEIDFQDKWQRARIGFAVVGPTPSHCTDVMDEVERHVWSNPDAQVVGADRYWLETE